MKKIFSLILSSVIMLSLVNMPVNAENTSERILKLGDYITLGKYQGEDIVWRYVADDENGKMFFAEDVLCEKNYLKENVFVSAEGDWADSTIHLWLNSENNIDMFENVYETENRIDWREDGFLSDSNFTDTEKLVIKGVKHRCKITDGYARGYYPSYNIPKYYYIWASEFSFSEGYSDYEFSSYHLDEYNSLPENSVVDRMFLPDVKEILTIHKNFEGYVQKEAAYWLRTPEFIKGDTYHGKFFAVSPIGTKASKLEKERGFEFITIEQGGYAGIRPAFYLNEEVAEIVSGSGTIEAPFVIDGKCTEGLQLGDYISFGTYKGADLLWRYVSDDENGKLFVTDYCVFTFADELVEWKDSSIRDYLRNDFLTEKNFKAEEIELVKNVTINTASVENVLYGHSDYYPFYYTKEYNDEEKFNSFSVSDEESIFLLGFGQISDIHNNYAVLGDYLRSISDNKQGCEYISYYDWEKSYSYLWKLRDRALFGYGGQGGDYNIYNENIYIDPQRPYVSHYHYATNETDEIGIRPGFYLDESKMQILSGKGINSEPYVIGSRVPELFEKNSLYGYKDSNGNVIVPPKFLKGLEFENGAALVILPENPNELRFIKPDGTYLFDKAFSAVNNFNSGHALIVANDKGEYSYINKKGEVATELLFEKAENFDRGLARVVFQGKAGVIDTLFNFYPDEICEDYTLVKNHSGYYLTIQSHGAVIYENLYETKPCVECVKDNVYKITEDITTVYIDIEKNMISETYYYLLYADEKYIARSIDYSDTIYITDIFDKDKVFYIVDPKVDLGFYCEYLKEMEIVNGVVYLKYTDYYKNNYEKEIPLTDDLKP